MKKYLVFLVLVGVHLFILVRLQFTAWPEMLSFPYIVDKGFLIYKDFHHVYQPLLTLVLAYYYKLIGFSVIGLKLFTWSLVVLVDFLIFLVSKKILGRSWNSLVPLLVFVLLQPAFEGNMLWYDLMLVPFILCSVYFLFQWSEKRNLINVFLTGLFLSLGFLIKQQEILLFMPFLAYLLINRIKIKQLFVFFVGAVLPIICLIVFLLVNQNFDDYLFWTFMFPFYWLPRIPGYKVLPLLKEWEVLIVMVVVPAFGIFYFLKRKGENFVLTFLFVIFVLEVVLSFPRFSFFHLQPALATFAIICGYLLSSKKSVIVFLSVTSLLFIGIYRWKLVAREFNHLTRFYGDEETHLAQRVDMVTSPNDKIYLLGPNAVVYVLANRIPPKPWIENYVWHFEIPGMQEKVISGWEHDPPKVIFWTPPEPGSWYDLGTYQPKKIADWIKMNYIHKEDTKSGVGVWYLK